MRGHFQVVRSSLDAQVLLGCVRDTAGQIHGWIELWVQTAAESVDALMNKMVGRRMSVQYDPENPGACYIPAEKVEGCRIEQNIGSQVKFYPRGQA